jgi:Skp family chaperone for outer membrane proteins
MKTKTTILLTISLLCFSLISTAQRGIQIGYIDMEYILESVPDYREAQTQLSGKVQRWKQDIDKMQNEIDQMKLDLANERVLLTNELIEEREEEIQIKEEEMSTYQQNRFGPNGDLMIQRRQLVQPIQDQVFNIIQEIAENRKYDFIFDKSADVVMLFAAKRHDISDMVLRSIERAGRRVQAQTRKEQREIEREEQQAMKESEGKTEREQMIEDKRKERETEIEQIKREREETINAKQRERDSIREQRLRDREQRRREMEEERQRRRDSILEARENRQRD